MEGLRFPELIIILILVAVLFGPQKIAGIGSGLGKAIRDFKNAVNSPDEAPKAAPPAPQALPPSDATASGAQDGGGAREAVAAEAPAPGAGRDPTPRA